jgi:hypothetical protein
MAITKISPDVVDFDAGITITTDDNSDNLTLTSTDADANAGPNINLYRNSGSPADGDNIGQIDFEGRNDNSQDVVYANMLSRIRDNTDSTEDGGIEVNVMKDGTLKSLWKYYSNGTTSELSFNDESIDMDFRVESDNLTHALFIQGSDGAIGIGTSTPASYSAYADNLVVAGANQTGITVASADSSKSGLYFADGTSGAEQYAGFLDYDHSDNNLYIGTNGANKLIVQSGGNASIVDGNLVVASGHGIDFSATSDGTTMSSELLDDYEEGSFDPAIIGSSSNPTVNYSSRGAKYVKVGSTVHVTLRLYWTSISGGGGNLKVAGFPFTSGALNGDWWTGTVGYTAASHWDSGKQPNKCMLAASDTGMLFWPSDGTAAITTADHDDGSGELYIQITYHTF